MTLYLKQFFKLIQYEFFLKPDFSGPKGLYMNCALMRNDKKAKRGMVHYCTYTTRYIF